MSKEVHPNLVLCRHNAHAHNTRYRTTKVFDDHVSFVNHHGNLDACVKY